MLIFELDWRDLIEISMISFGFYHLFSWLAVDKQSPLLLYSYRYGMIALTCYFLSLNTISLLLLLGSPLWLMLLVTFHHSSLQRNFVTARMQKKEVVRSDSKWHQELIRAIAHHKNNNQTVTFLLEQQHNLALLVTPGISCNAPVTHALISFIIASKQHDPHSLIWVTKDGYIKSINAQWRSMESVDWYNAAMAYTAQTDAIVLQSNPNQIIVVRAGTVEQNKSLTTLPQFFANLHSAQVHKSGGIS